ncbi:MAG: PDZ domain-containing protein, partial [bacterium]|nr:PDZ domain-containing protein [bacterium]
MKRTLSFAVLALLIAFAGTAMAGDQHAKKCSADAQTCLNKLAAKIQSKAWLGVELEKTDSGWSQITAVIADSPAEAAGFQAGDVLVAMNGVVLKAENKEEIWKVKKGLAPGSTATYIVKREGGKQKLAVTLSHVPATVM